MVNNVLIYFQFLVFSNWTYVLGNEIYILDYFHFWVTFLEKIKWASLGTAFGVLSFS